MIVAKMISAALANHLWQSTMFAAAAALLAWALRNNRAQARYALWLAASLKFLFPFSLLMTIGTHLQWPASAPVAHPALSVAIQQMGQPFAVPMVVSRVSQPAVPAPTHALAVILLIIWACGVAAVLLSWSKSWMRVRAAVRAAAPLGLEAPIQVLSSPSLIEPGVFGVLRPVLLLPAGISDHLAPAHLEAILAHELCHVRRRDNLAAAFHMLVEALFWFHPLVWWIGARLVEERERACDEEVLRLGNKPQVYAESILKTCQFYLESPLACMSGVTGSDLKKRVVHIMTEHLADRLNLRKKLLLATAAVAAVALPLASGLVNASENHAQSQPASDGSLPAFEVATVKPSKSTNRGSMLRIQPGGRFAANGVTAAFLLQEAYGVKESQVSQAPPWFNSERFDIEAKPEESLGAAMDKLPPEKRKDELMRMMQSLLSDRFKLTLGHETKELPVYALVVAKNGPKFHESTFKPPENEAREKLPDSPRPPQKGGPPHQGIFISGRGELTETYADLTMFANVLSRLLGRVVLDKTGLTGKYDFTLRWTPDESQGGAPFPGGPKEGPDGAPPPEASGPSLFTAVQEQLGLKLESQKAPLEILVIEHVERPSEN